MMHWHKEVLFAFCLFATANSLFLAAPQLPPSPTKPNLVWFLTDDQDQLLGASFPVTSEATPMPKTKKLMQDEGVYASNFYSHTPICSPSRAELLTGRYFHNIKQVGGTGYCANMHVNYAHVMQGHFGKLLKDAGYTTGMFGKYVSGMDTVTSDGWDAWFANDGGTYIGPKFEAKNIDGFQDGQVNFSNDPSNYSTSVIGNVSLAWIRKVAEQGNTFLAYIATKAPHEPFNPAPWYSDHWDPSWPEHEPRGDNWNCSFESRKDHHGNIATEPMITAEVSNIITGVFKNRWRTLMSVDDVIAAVISLVDELNLLDKTYFFFSSDHGYQLGQFNIPMDKRHFYEWDTKIHLLAKGPGIMHGTSFAAPGTLVDIAPTLLGLAGVQAPATMDGHSIVPFLVDAQHEALLDSTRQHLAGLGNLNDYRTLWRKEVFIEYYYCSFNMKCLTTTTCSSYRGDYPNSDSNCVNLADNTDCWCGGLTPTADPECYATEDLTNNFIALREIGESGNVAYAEFQIGDMMTWNIQFDEINFIEYFNLTDDPWQLRNLAKTASNATLDDLHNRLHEWFMCAGTSCP